MSLFSLLSCCSKIFIRFHHKMLTSQTTPGFRGWDVTFVTTIAFGIVLGGLFYNHGAITEEWSREVLRFTGRASFPLFLLMFSASSVNRLFPSSLSRWLVQNRKYMGLAFAILYVYHSVGLVGLRVLTGSSGIEGLELFLSIAAYIFMVAMIMTSFDAIRRKMSRWAWQSLHGTGMLIIWYFFLAEFIHKAEDSNFWFYTPLAALSGLTMVLRVVAFAKPSRSASPC